MAKIKEVIELYPAMSKTVNLRNEFYDKVENRKRMRGYRPIKSHRKLLLKIAKSFLPNETKVHLLVGHYGTGKSHLLLMLANYFSEKLEMPELKKFFETFDEVDEETSKSIKNLRGEGRYLVAIPNYSSKEDFSENLLKSIDYSFEKEGFSEEIDSVYKEALRTLKKWEKEETEGSSIFQKFSKFKDLLSESDSINSVMILKRKLEKYNRSALIIFKDIYKQMETQPFRYNADNIAQILDETVKSDAFKERYKGIIILFDEFDYTLKNRRISMEVVQDFAELCKNSNKIIFVGALHKELSSFANKYSEADFKTAKERFTTQDMRKEGLEEIAGAIVSIKKESPVYLEKVKNNMQQVYEKSNDINRLNLFPWLEPDEINEKIIDAVYPLHPLTMACILKLSTTIGSYNRTLFTFLGGEGIDEENAFSYKAFIEGNDIIGEDGLLNLYTTDLLVDYFKKELDVDNPEIRDTIKKIVSGYNTSLKQYKENTNLENTIIDVSNPLNEKILKLMLIFEIVGIDNRESNFLFGLNIQKRDSNKLKQVLKKLKQQKVIFYNGSADVYEFRQGTEKDWQSQIDEEKVRMVEEQDYDIREDFFSIEKIPGKTKFLEAKKYNGIKHTDRRMLRKIEIVQNFGEEKVLESGNRENYFKYLENKLTENRNWNENYDGMVIYLLVENKEEIREAVEKSKLNNSDYIMVVIPENEIEIEDNYLNLKAAKLIQDTDYYQDSSVSDQARLEQSFIGDTNKNFIKAFNDKREKYLKGKLSVWYGKNGKIIERKPNDEQDVVCKFLLELYDKFNDITDDELNKIHKKLSGNKKFIFSDAIKYFIKSGSSLKIDTSYGNDKGFIRYLKNVLFDEQLLRKIGKDKGIINCEIEKDTLKYKRTFPALVDMIDEIKQKNEIKIEDFVKKYRAKPYGLGQYSLMFFITFLIKYFGDELTYKENPTVPGEINIQIYEQIEKIVNDSKKFSIFKKRKLTSVQKKFIVKIFNNFSEEQLSVGDLPRMKDAVLSIKDWFENLNKLNKSEDFYDKEKIKKYVEFLNECNPADAYNTLFSKIQTVWGFEEDDRFDERIKKTILKDIKDFNTIIENKDEEVKNSIFKKYLEMFNSEGKTYDNLADSINEWYNELDANQSDLAKQNNESQPLIKYLKETQKIQNVIFNLIPSSQNYDLRKVEDWNTVKNIEIYINKVKRGLEKIEQLKTLVNKPIITGKDYKSDNPILRYDKKSLDLTIQSPDNVKNVLVSYGGKDPREKDVQVKKISGKEKLIPTKSDQKIKMVSVDNEGNFSEVVSIDLKENHIGWISKDLYNYSIEIPKKEIEVGYIIKGLSEELINSKKITKSKLIGLLKGIIKEYDI